MKKLLGILVLILFSIQTPSQADDIRDFQIEGMSIGDSLLNIFSKKEIEKGKIDTYPNSNKFSTIQFWEPTFDFEMYDSIGISFKTNDSNYLIFGIAGAFFYDNNIEVCYKKKDEITKELSILFENAKIENVKGSHPVDKSGKSKTDTTYFDFKSGDNAKVGCVDYSKEFEKKGKVDHLQIAVYNSEYRFFLSNEAYK